MRCASCRYENPSSAKFCLECGAVLATRCAQCGTELPAAAKFCLECGHQVTVTPPSAPPTPSLMPHSFASGRYQVQRFLGEGAKKRVYLAHDTRLNRDVAIAVIKTEGLDGDGLARVRREAQAMGRLGDHAHIVTIYDVAEEGGQVYIVSQYMPGGDLEGRLHEAEGRRLPIGDALQIVAEICDALKHAHGLEIIHRDIKPGNIYLGADGKACLGDFGLAVALDRSRITQDGMLIGTAAYMAPEQALGGQVTACADLYALGALLYEMLTGRPPFVGDDPVAVISQHMNTPPVKPTWHNPDIPPELEALILQLLAKNPEKRPESAAKVREALAAIRLAPVRVSRAETLPPVNPLDRLATSVFVGREEEVGQLREGLDQAVSGRGTVLMLVGEPGIGKTRTAEELSTYARMRGAQALWGRCHEDAGAPPYWPWVQLIRSYVHEREPKELLAEMGPGAADIAEIVSAVRERLPNLPAPPKVEPDQARFRLFESITTFLKNASKRQPLALILDDLHWADKPSLLLLQFLASEIGGTRVLLLGTYRDVELRRKHPLSKTLAELARRQTSERILLRGLTKKDVARFIEQKAHIDPPEPLVEAVFRETEGNPFFIQEVVNLLASEGKLEKPEEVTSWSVTIPQGVREVVGLRLNQLSDECNRLLSVASVVGREFELDVLERIVSVPSDEVLDLIEQAVAARVVEELPDSVGQYRFSHALIRETLYEELTTARRVRLHRQAGEALEEVYADKLEPHLAELARHFIEAAPGGDVNKAIDYAVRAGNRALEQLAYEEAVSHFEGALQALDLMEPADQARRCEVLLSLGDAHIKAAQYQRAMNAFQQAAEIARGLKNPEYLTRAAIGFEDGRRVSMTPFEPSLRLLEESLAALGEQDNALRARALAKLASALIFSGEEERKQQVSLEAVEMARRVGNPEALCDALQHRLDSLMGPGYLDERLSLSAELVQMAEKYDFKYRAAVGHFFQMSDLLTIGDIRAADREIEAGARLVKELRDARMVAHARLYRGLRALMQGRFDECEKLAMDAFATGQRIQSGLMLNHAGAQIFLLRWAQGRVEELETAINEFGKQYPELFGWRCTLAFLYSESGRKAEARALFEELAANDFLDFPRDATWLVAIELLSNVCHSLGDRRRAELLYELLRPYAQYNLVAGLGASYAGSASLYLGLLATTMSRYDDAARHFEDALDMNTRTGAKPNLAQTQYRYACMLLHRDTAGDRERALELASQALEAAHQMGMKSIAERALATKLEIQGLDSAEKSPAMREPVFKANEPEAAAEGAVPLGAVISHYRILEKLGEGGMGVVYKAQDTMLERTVALKFLSQQMLGGDEDRIRFVREAKAAAALDHPNICTVHEINEAEGKIFMAMSYIDGPTLADKLESGPLPVAEAVTIAIQVAEGLQEAHQKGIIHRDIKSANIMLSRRGRAKIMDFGLAKLTGRTRLTRTATIMGTVAYMSPEQAQGEAGIDHRTDIWSLGAVLYEMLTGVTPFDAPSDVALIHKIIYEDLPDARSLNPDAPPALTAVISRAMAKKVDDRYASIAEMLDDLRSFRAAQADAPAAARPIGKQERPAPSIAVLPFVNMSADPEQEYFCDGIAEELINALTKLRNLRVIARTSAFSFKGKDVDVRDIGKRLDVQAVLEGSVRKAGNRLRITAQLIDTAGGHHLWSEQYNREMADVFAIQDEIAHAIVGELKPRLLPGERRKLAKRQTVDLEAYDLYLKGRYFFNKRTREGLETALRCFEQATKKAPEYALVYAGMADVYSVFAIYSLLPPREVYPKARAAALRALEIDDRLAEAHVSLGYIKSFHDWDWKASEREFKRAIDLNPLYPDAHMHYSHCLMFMERLDEAVTQAEETLALDPLSPIRIRNLGFIYLSAERYDRAAEILRKLVEMEPNFPLARLYLGFVFSQQSLYEEALIEFEKAREITAGRDPLAEMAIGVAYALLGRRDEAREILKNLMKRSKKVYVPSSSLGRLKLALGETDEGFELLGQAYEERDQFLPALKMEKFIDLLDLRSDPRYIALLKNMNLEP